MAYSFGRESAIPSVGLRLQRSRLKRAGIHALEALESRITPSTLVTLSAGHLSVVGDAGGGGEDESLIFTVADGSLRISDPGHAIVAGHGVVQEGEHAVLAPLISLTDSLRVSTGSGHDSVEIDGALPTLHAFGLQSNDPASSVVIHGSIVVQGADGKGGTIAITAGRVALEGATLDASGPSGGGAILVGGDFQGGGSLAHAQFVTVDAASVLRADALSAGHGGKVVVWSDQLTSFAGTVSARGGAAGGDGGTLEVSGRQLLEFRGLGNASAPHGHAGSLLLDPKNITVDSAAALGAPVTTLAFGDQTGQSVSLHPDSVTATLNTGTAVTLQASNDLTVNSAITANNPGGAGGALTLQAGRSILLNAGITTDDGALILVANDTVSNGVVNADRDPGAAVMTMASGVSLNAGAGTVTITMGSGAGLTNGTSGDLTLRAISAGALSVTNQGPTAGTTVNLLGAIATAGATTFAADALALNTTTGSVNAGAVTLKPFTAGRTIDLGTKTAGTLGFTDAEMDRVTAGLLQIGDSASGAISVSATLTPVSSLGLTTGAGIALNQAVTMAANKNFTATAVGTISFPNTTSDLTTSGTGFVAITTATNISLASGSSITTVDGALALSANQQAVPSAGDFQGLSMSGAVVKATGAGNVSVAARGGTGPTLGQYGVGMDFSSTIRTGTGTVTVQGTGGAGGTGIGQSSNYGLRVTGTITSGGGNVLVMGQGGGSGAGAANIGVEIISGGLVTAGGLGSVTVQGTGGTATGNQNVGVFVSAGSTITSSGGPVQVTGTGRGSGASAQNYGVWVEVGSQITSGTGGAVTVVATGGVGAGGTNHGVALNGTTSFSPGTITSGGGALTVTATAGAGTGSFGVALGLPGAGFTAITTAANGGNLTILSDSISMSTSAFLSTKATDTLTIRPLTAGTAIDLGGADVAGTLGLSAAELALITTGTLQLGSATSGAINVSATLTPAYSLALSTGGGINFGASITLAADKSLTANAAGTISAPAGSLAATGTGGISLTSGRNIALSGGGTLSVVNGAIALSANQQAVPATGTFDGIKVSAGYTVQSTGTGTITLLGKSGSTGSSTAGIDLTTGGRILGGAGLVDLQGTGVAGGGSTTGILIDSLNITTITTTGGNVKLTGVGGGAGTTTNNYGVSLAVDTVVTAGGSGSVTVQGTGGNTAGTGNCGVATLGAITSSGGPVSVTGLARGTVGGDYGIVIGAGGSLTAGGLGTLVVNGTGGNGGDSEVGVYLSNGNISSAGGNVQIIGQGGGNAGNGGGTNCGLLFDGGTVLAGGSGSLVIQGTGGGNSGGLGNMGVLVQATSTMTLSSGGPLQITGIAGPGTSAFGIRTFYPGTIGSSVSGGNVTLIADTMDLRSAAGIKTPATGTVTLRPFTAGTPLYVGPVIPAGSLGFSSSQLGSVSTGTLQLGDANTGSVTVNEAMVPASHLALTTAGGIDFGSAITMAANKNLTATAASTIAVSANLAATGTGAISLTTANGISVAVGKTISTVDGNLTLSANQQATASSGTFIGISLAGTGSTVQATGAGNVSLLGKGGKSGVNQIGVQLSAGAKVQGGTTGSLLLQGTGGASSGGSAFGVSIGGAGALVTSSGGPVQVTGQGGGAGTVTVSYGVSLSAGGTISAGGTGSVTVQGTGGNFGSTNVGVLVYPVNAKITSSGGNVLVVGQGGGGSGSTLNDGVLVNGSQITAGGLGTVTVQGTGGVGNFSYGVNLQGSSGSSLGLITSSGGAVQVTATAGTGTSVGLHVGDTTFGSFGTITTAANGGNLTLISDGMAFTTDAIISAGAGSTVTLRPKTAGTLINLGGTDGGRLALAAAELNVISAGTVQIGDAASGAITVSAAVAPNFNLSLTTGAGIAFSAGVTMAADKSLTATAASATTGIITLGFSVSTLAASGTGAIALTAGHNIALSSGSSITTADGNLSLSANQQTTAATGTFYGISVTGATVRVTGAGTLTLLGRGGDNANGGQTGVEIAGTVQGGTSGLVTVQGTGGPSSGSGTFNNGVELTGGSITSSGANVQVTGVGGGIGNSSESVGVYVTNSAQITAGGAGTVTVQGTGGAGSGGGHVGVFVAGSTAAITSSGGNVHVIGQGGLSTSSSNRGVEVDFGKIMAGGSGTVLVEGTGGGGSSYGNDGVFVGSTITSSGGNVQVIGTGAGGGGFESGVWVYGNGTVTAGGSGTVTVQGTGGATGGGNKGVQVDGTVTSGGGNVSVTGLAGGNGTGSSNFGLFVNAGQITAGGTGTVTVQATGGGGTGGANDGLHLEGASNAQGKITSGGGAVKVTGVAGTSGTSASYGLLSGFSYFPYGVISTATNGGALTLLVNSVSLTPETVISTPAAGTMTIAPATAGTAISLGSKPAGSLGLLNADLARFSTGTLQVGDANSGAISTGGALSPAFNLSLTTPSTITLGHDITMAANKSFTANAAGTLSATAGNLTATGTGAISLSSARNISLSGTGSVKTVDGALSLSANQQAVPTAGSFTGISISGYTVQSTGAGALSLMGKGGDGTGAAPTGIQISSAGKVIGGTGLVDVRGTGGPSSITSRGVFLNGSGVSVTSTGGNVQVTGQGGGTGASLVDNGVELAAGSTISAGGNGTVTVQGTGGNGTAGSNIGVENTGTIASSGGNVSVTGQGTSTGSGSNYGVDVSGAGLISAGGAGQVSVTGTGGQSSLSSHEVGVSVIGGGRITSGGGNVLVTGQGGGTGTGGANYGVYLQPGGTVSAAGTGSVTILGTGGGGSGGGNHGVDLLGSSTTGALVTSGGGPVQITGIPGAGGFGNGINLDSYGTISTAASGGDITLITDTISSAAPNTLIATQSTGKMTLRPQTAGTQIYAGDSIPAGALGFSAFQLAALSTGTLQLGDANSGSITIAGALTPAYHLSLTTGGGIAVNAGITMAANKNVTATAAGSIAFGAAGFIVANGGIVSLAAGPAGALSTSDSGVKITANRLSIVAGAGIGSALAPLGYAVTTLETNTAAGNGDQYLRGSATVGAAGLNAGTGTINLLDNTFTLSASNSLGDLSKLKLTNATLAMGTFNDTVAGVSLLGGAITGTGTLTSASDFDFQSGTVSAGLAGGVGVAKTTAGTVFLSGANSYTGLTTVAAGILNVRNATVLGGTAVGTIVSAGATLQFQGIISAEPITVSGTGAAGGTGALEAVSGSNTLNALVTLAGSTKISLDANSGFTFPGGIADPSGASDLTVTVATNGIATLAGGVGVTVPLKSITASNNAGLVKLGGSIKTTGAQSYDGTVTVSSTGTLTTTNSAVTFGGPVTLTSPLTVNAGAAGISFLGTVDGPQVLTANSTGATLFGSTVGVTVPVSKLLTNAGGTTTVSGDVFTDISQIYGDDVIVAANSTLSSNVLDVTFKGKTTLQGDLFVATNFGEIKFMGTVDGAHGLSFSDHTPSGGVWFYDRVGSVTPLAFIDAARRFVNFQGESVTTTGAQTYRGRIYLETTVVTSLGGGAISLPSVEVLTSDIRQDLTVNTAGQVTFNGIVGATGPVGNLSVTAGAISLVTTAVNSIGNQTFDGPLKLALTQGSTATLTSSGGSISLREVDGNYALTASAPLGSVALHGNLGAVTPVLALDVTAPSIVLDAATVRTGSTQSYHGPVRVASSTALTTANSAITFASTINGTTAGGQSLTLHTGTAGPVFGGVIGGIVPLAGLTVDAQGSYVLPSRVTTTGAQTYGGNVTTAGGVPGTVLSTTNGAVSFGGTANLAGDLTVNAGSGDVTFAGALTGSMSRSLNVNSKGATSFNGPVGSAAATFGYLYTDAGGTTTLAGDHYTISEQYGDDLIVAAPVQLTVTGPFQASGNTTLNSDLEFVHAFLANFKNVDGAHNLTYGVQLPSGQLQIFGPVGSLTPLASVKSGAVVYFQGGSITTTGDQFYGGGISVAADTSLLSTNNGVISTGTIYRPFSDHSLTISSGATGAVNLGKTNTSLGSLNVSGLAPINVAGDVTTTGAQSYAGAVTLANSVTLSTTDANISFGSTIDGTTPYTQSLVLRAGAGALSFGGAIGGTVPLANFTTESGAAALVLPAITLGGNLSVTAGGAISQTGPHVIAGTAFYTGAGIDLSQPGNDFAGVLTLASTTVAPTTVKTANALTLAAASFGGSLSATALQGDLKIAGRIDYNGALNLTASGVEKAVIVSADVINSGYGDDVLQATGDVVVRNGAALVTNGSRLALIADSDQSHSGAILVGSGSIVENHGGGVQLTGADLKLPAYGSGAVYDGIALNAGVTILGDVRAGGGYTYVNGHGKTDPAPQDGHNFGVLIDGNGGLTSSGAGSITIFASAGPGSAAFALASVNEIGSPRLGDDGSETMTGGIDLEAEAADEVTDSVRISGVIHSRGALTIRGLNSSVGLAGANGTLSLSATELAQLADGFSSITIQADGVLTANAVTFTDPLNLQGNAIDLQGTVGAGANKVTLDAGTGTITLEPAAVFTLKAAGVIGDASKVDLRGGTLDLGAFNETVGGLQLLGGTINAAGGTLTSATTFELLKGDVHASLAGKTPTVGLLKLSDFTVTLSAASTYSGGTTIRSGTLQFSHPRALGTGAVILNDVETHSDNTALLATAVMNDSLAGGTQGAIDNNIVVANFGTGKSVIGTTTFNAVAGLDSSTTFAGGLTLNKATTLQGGNSSRTVFSGYISGSTVTVEGGARVVISNSGNLFQDAQGLASDVRIVGAGTILQVEGSGDALSTARNVDVGAGARLGLAANSLAGVSLRSLSGAGLVRSEFAGKPQSLVISDPVGGGNFTGIIADGASPVSLLKLGNGTQTLAGLMTYTGNTMVNGGTLALGGAGRNNNLPSSPVITIASGATLDVTGLDQGTVLDTLVLASGQKLQGAGTVAGRLQAPAGSTFAPDNAFPAFATGNLTLAGSTFAAVVDRAETGLNGEVNVHGTVSLGDAVLNLSGALGSSPGQRIVLIQNDGVDPVVGTFHGLHDGSIVPLNGVSYILNYHGGDGNDVTLEEGRSIYVVAAGVTTAGAYGLPVVKVYNAHSGSEIFSITAYETKLRDGIRVAVADMNGDGYDDIITTTAVGTGRLRVFDGLTGKRFTSGPFAAELAVFDGKTDKGAFVAAGDLTGDGRADLIVGSALGGGKVRVFDGVTGAALTFATGQTFLQPFGKTFKGGIRVAAGDVNGDHLSDLMIGENYYGAKVQVYSGASLFAPAAPLPAPLLSFDFGPKGLKTGVNLAVGDYDHDGLADLLLGTNAGPTYVQTYSGLLKDSAGLPKPIGTPIYPFDASPLKHLYARGVRVASFDVNGDGIADIIAASSGLAKSVVNVYSGADHTLLRTFSAFPTLPNSALFVAASA